MIINHNLNALNAHRLMTGNTASAGKSMEKLSSGLRINRAGDDAAGLAISEKMRGQIRGLDQASRNAQDGISMIQTAEGGLNETHSILQRMRELAVQAGNDTNNTVDRGEIQKEINQLTSELNRIGNTTEFNTQKLLNGEKDQSVSGATLGVYGIAGATTSGAVLVDTITVLAASAGIEHSATAIANAINGHISLSNKYTAVVSGTSVRLTQKVGSATAPTASVAGTTGVTTVTTGASGTTVDGRATLQIGANEDQTFTVEIKDMRAVSLGLASTTASGRFTTGDGNQLTDTSASGAPEYALDVSDAELATAAIKTINDAIVNVSSERSRLGAYQNRLEHTINNLNTSSENLTSAESRVRDVDMAKEMMNFSKNNILSQAAQAMLAQANQQPQGVLQLLR